MLIALHVWFIWLKKNNNNENQNHNFVLCFFNLSFFIYQMIQIYLSHFIVLLWQIHVQYLNIFLYKVIFSSLFLFHEILVILFLFLLTFTFHTYLLFLSLSLLCQYLHLISFIWNLFWYITFYSLQSPINVYWHRTNSRVKDPFIKKKKVLRIHGFQRVCFFSCLITCCFLP